MRPLRSLSLRFAAAGALLAGTPVLAARGIGTAPAAPPASAPVTYQRPWPVATPWAPLRDGLRGGRRTSSHAATAPAALRAPRSSAAQPNFGGFRVAPSTPAHAPGDDSRDLSSAAADFDHDGCKDVVTFQVANLTLMRGDCAGGFTRAQSQATVQGVYHPVAVDVNHDGYPDIVAMTFPFAYLGTVVVLRNQKDGTFSAPQEISRPASVFSGLMDMNVYDINGDGAADVVIAGMGTTDDRPDTDVVFEVVFGNADGSFATSTLVETHGVIASKADLGFDGATALRTIGDQLYLYGLVMQARRVNGTNFVSEQIYRWTVSKTGAVDAGHPRITALPVFSPTPNKYIQFADLDGDAVDDFALLDGDGMLYTAIGAPDGGLGPLRPALPPTAGNNAAVTAFRDVDGDGKVDAVMAGAVYVGVWPGNGDGTFRAPRATHLAGYAFNGLIGLVFPVTNHVIDDFDGDGVADIAFLDAVKRALCFYRGKRDGTFVGAAALVNQTGEFQTNNLIVQATPDLNGDGHKDVVVASPYGLLGGLSDGAGGFTYQILAPLFSVAGISDRSADFDRDGKDDLVMLSLDDSGAVHLALGLSKGDGTVTAVAQALPVHLPSAPGIAIGDINGDGAPDLLLAVNDTDASSFGVWPLLNDGHGVLTAGAFIRQDSPVFGLATGDVNGDGAADLLVSYGSFEATTTAVYPATGAGRFAATPSAVLQHTLPADNILVDDVTGDGALDAVVSVAAGDSAGLILYAGRKDGTFSQGTQLVTGVVPVYVGDADLNGDGLADLFFSTAEVSLTDASDGLLGLVVLRGAGNGAFAAPLRYAIYGSAAPVLPIDLFHDGSPSLLAASGDAGTTLLFNNGATRIELGASTARVAPGAAVDVTVRVAPAFADQARPSGYVNLRVDGAVVDRRAVRSDGAAVFSLSGLAIGQHALSASYEGDARYHVNQRSNTVSLTVGDAVPAFQLSASDLALALAPGGSASTTISLAANPAFSGPVTLSCEGGPPETTCALSQRSVMLAPGQTVASTLTVTASRSAAGISRTLLGGAAGAAACCALLLAALGRRRCRPGRLALALLASAGALAAGCASDSTARLSTRSYAIVVTATPSAPDLPAQKLTVVVDWRAS